MVNMWRSRATCGSPLLLPGGPGEGTQELCPWAIYLAYFKNPFWWENIMFKFMFFAIITNQLIRIPFLGYIWFSVFIIMLEEGSFPSTAVSNLLSLVSLLIWKTVPPVHVPSDLHLMPLLRSRWASAIGLCEVTLLSTCPVSLPWPSDFLSMN